MQINEMYACAFSEKKKGEPGDDKSGRFAGALYLDDAPRDFGPEIAFRFQIPSLLERQGGREISNPSQYLTDPFYTASQLGTLNVPKLGTAHI